MARVVKVDNWSDYVMTRLNNFQANSEQCDLSLMCNNQQIKVHRAVICACSEYFRNITKRVETIILPNELSFNALKDIIGFMYTGKLEITPENKRHLLFAVNLMKIPIRPKIIEDNDDESNENLENGDHRESSGHESTIKIKMTSSGIKRKRMDNPNAVYDDDVPSERLKSMFLPYERYPKLRSSVPRFWMNFNSMRMEEVTKPLRFEMPEEFVTHFYYATFNDISYETEPFIKDVVIERENRNRYNDNDYLLSGQHEDDVEMKDVESPTAGSRMHNGGTIVPTDIFETVLAEDMEAASESAVINSEATTGESQPPASPIVVNLIENEVVEKPQSANGPVEEEMMVVVEDSSTTAGEEVIPKIKNNPVIRVKDRSALVEEQNGPMTEESVVPDKENKSPSKKSSISVISEAKLSFKGTETTAAAKNGITEASDLQKILEDDDIPEENSVLASGAADVVQVIKNESQPVAGQLKFEMKNGKIDAAAGSTRGSVILKGVSSADVGQHQKLIESIFRTIPNLSGKNICLKINSSPNLKSLDLSKLVALNGSGGIDDQHNDVAMAAEALREEVKRPLRSMSKKKTVIEAPAVAATKLKLNPVGPWICTTCQPEVEFNSYHYFRDHLQEKHRMKSDNKFCDFCGHKAQKRNLQLHHLYAQHCIPPPDFISFPKCEICDHIALNNTALLKHMESRHSTEEDEQYECKCEKTFTTKDALAEHVKICDKYSRKNKPMYKCIACKMTFDRMINLKAHIRINHKHLREKLLSASTQEFLIADNELDKSVKMNDEDIKVEEEGGNVYNDDPNITLQIK